MDYFSDLEFVACSGNALARSSCSDHYFNGYYGIQFIYAGKVTIHTENRVPEQASAPVVFFTCPGVAFSYGSPRNTMRGHIWICFKGPRADRYCKTGLLELRKENLLIPVADPAKLLNMMKECTRYMRTPGEYAHGDAVLLLEKILLFIRKQENSPAESSPELAGIRHLAETIAGNPGSALPAEEAAGEFHISQVHFRRLFRMTTGFSYWDYVLDCRMRHAACLLLSGDKLVKETAALCGYNDEFHFSREFKRKTGKSPDEFRRCYQTP